MRFLGVLKSYNYSDSEVSFTVPKFCCNGLVVKISKQRRTAQGNPYEERQVRLGERIWNGHCSRLHKHINCIDPVNSHLCMNLGRAKDISDLVN